MAELRHLCTELLLTERLVPDAKLATKSAKQSRRKSCGRKWAGRSEGTSCEIGVRLGDSNLASSWLVRGCSDLRVCNYEPCMVVGRPMGR